MPQKQVHAETKEAICSKRVEHSRRGGTATTVSSRVASSSRGKRMPLDLADERVLSVRLMSTGWATCWPRPCAARTSSRWVLDCSALFGFLSAPEQILF